MAIEVRPRAMTGLWEIIAPPAADHRGFMFKAYDQTAFAGLAGSFTFSWKQVIQSHTERPNTVRGLYVQTPPFTEGKMVSCLRGRSFWVVVDLRRGSETFGRWDGVTLEGGDGRSLLIAPGFAHGCVSLSADVDLLLLADNLHSDAHGAGIAWNDPEIGIEWPLTGEAILSPGHAVFPSFAEFRTRIGGIGPTP